MKWKPDLPNRITLMYYWSKLIGLAPFTLKNDKFDPPTIWDKIYSVTLVGIHSLLASLVIRKKIEIDSKESASPTIGQSVGTLYLVVSSFSTSIMILIFAMRHEKIIELAKKLCSMSDDLKKTGFQEDGGKLFTNIFVTNVTVNVLNEIIIVGLYFLDSRSITLFTILYNINISITLNMILIFSQILRCIRNRFAFVNEKLCSFDPTLNDNSLLHLQGSTIFVVGRKTPEENRAECDDLTDIQRFRKMELLHLELCDFVHRIANIFAAPILLSMLRMFFRLLLFSYWICRTISNAIQPNAEEYFSSTWRSVTYYMVQLMFMISELFVIAHVCVTTCEQGNATRIVVSKLRNKIKSSELQDELYMFYIQLLHTPVVISVYKFFDLNYGVLYKIFCTIVAYLIIMIQVEKT